VSWADKELKTYRQVHLAAGEALQVELRLQVSECSIVDADGNRLVEPGAFELLVGPSSRDSDLLAARFEVR
jgi:beta-glucosidase